ncbi:hypothetical protein SUSAZ_06160 [Sulfolobus acidocaldarius SUSAZ]|nr:hypothetical protein SUSAZ_06160 [Sulfolobus acidocaldarius SUSAZ]
MPVKYVCRNCGYTLYNFDKVGQDFYGVRTPSEIRSIFGGKCPRCGKPLNAPAIEDVRIIMKKKITITIE